MRLVNGLLRQLGATPRWEGHNGARLIVANPDNGTNRVPRRSRFNEAELVRERRDGLSRDSELTAEEDNGPERTLVRDPALARALDLLKGLAVVRHSRP